MKIIAVGIGVAALVIAGHSWLAIGLGVGAVIAIVGNGIRKGIQDETLLSRKDIQR